jgi:tRNA pseudouridine38-40 synthase
MRKAARYFIGRHDFNAFRDSGDEERKTVKRIKSLGIQKTGHIIRIRITADGFLKHMVRIVAGTLIEVGRGKLPMSYIKSLIASKDRKKSGPTAKPQGLTLLKVQY